MSQLPTNSVMDVDNINFSANVRERSYSSSRAITRSVLLSSSVSFIPTIKE